MGWGVLICVPALFLAAWMFGDLFERAPLCAVRMFLGFDCPGCGLSRSFVALVRGDIRASIAIHPMGVVIAVWFCYLFARQALVTVTGRQLGTMLSQKGRDIVLFGFLAGIFLQWFAKLLIRM